MTAPTGDDADLFAPIGTASRASTAVARQAFRAGRGVIVAEYDRGDVITVHRLTMVNTREGWARHGGWDGLAEIVRVWRVNYPNQTFYVVDA